MGSNNHKNNGKVSSSKQKHGRSRHHHRHGDHNHQGHGQDHHASLERSSWSTLSGSHPDNTGYTFDSFIPDWQTNDTPLAYGRAHPLDVTQSVTWNPNWQQVANPDPAQAQTQAQFQGQGQVPSYGKGNSATGDHGQFYDSPAYGGAGLDDSGTWVAVGGCAGADQDPHGGHGDESQHGDVDDHDYKYENEDEDGDPNGAAQPLARGENVQKRSKKQ